MSETLCSPSKSNDDRLTSSIISDNNGNISEASNVSNFSKSSEPLNRNFFGTLQRKTQKTNGQLPQQHTLRNEQLATQAFNDSVSTDGSVSWQLFSVNLHRTHGVGFGIAVSGGFDNAHFLTQDPAIIVSDVVPSGPAFGLLQVNDQIISANGVSLDRADYSTAISIMKDANQLNMIVKRRVPMPFMEFEQRTLKFTLSKSRKKDDFGIVLGCKYYIKEITNPKLAEKDPGLREGDTVLRINGQSLENVTIEEASRWLARSREKLSLVVQRDVRKGSQGSRWPSQNTVYERLGSVSATPRHSPTPVHYAQSMNPVNYAQSMPERKSSTGGENSKRMSDPMSLSRVDYQRPMNQQQQQQQHTYQMQPFPQQLPTISNGYGEQSRPNTASSINTVPLSNQIRPPSQTPSVCSSPRNFPNQREIRVVGFKKSGGSLGIRVIGGNQVGIFVSAVQDDSPAAMYGIRVGDRLISVNAQNMNGVTREQAVEYLLALNDDVLIKAEHAPEEFAHVRNNQLGDNFYIRTHFAYQKRTNRVELNFQAGDIFHITDTLFGGSIGLWQATKVYSASETEVKTENGVIPNGKTAEVLAKQSRIESSTLSRSLFKKKLQSRRTKSLTTTVEDDFLNGANGCNFDIPLPAYERVTLRRPTFPRPVVLFGPLADVARQLLLSNFALRFGTVDEEKIIRLNSVDTVVAMNKHPVLNITPGSVERLQLAQYCPIIIHIDVDSRSRVRDLRSKSGATTLSARKLLEQSSKIKKHYSHLLSATLDASKEDGWFEALRHLIFHLQDRRVWMPEFLPAQPLDDLLLFPMQNANTESDGDSSKGDYATSIYETRNTNTVYDQNSQPKMEDFIGPAYGSNNKFYSAFQRTNSPYAHSSHTTYGNSSPYIDERSEASIASSIPQRQAPGYYDIKQVLAENYGSAYATDSEASRSIISSSPYLPSNQNQNLHNLLYPKSRGDADKQSELLSLLDEHDTKPKSLGPKNENDLSYTHTQDSYYSFDTKETNGSNSTENPLSSPTVIEHVHGIMDWKGGKLECPESGVELLVPEAAIPFGTHQEIFIKVCKESQQNPPLDHEKKEALMSPLVMCGPQGLSFSIPVELRLPYHVQNFGADGNDMANFVLKSGSGTSWKNIELLRPPVRNPNEKFVSVLVNHF